jgi:hypothetical protein
MSVSIVEEQRHYGTRMWLQMVIQLKLVIPAPNAVLFGGKLCPRENGWPMLKRDVSLSTVRHFLSQQNGLATKRNRERKAEASITSFN